MDPTLIFAFFCIAGALVGLIFKDRHWP